MPESSSSTPRELATWRRGARDEAESLKTAALGSTGLEITRVGFGAWAIGGGGWEFGWGPQDDEESIAAIHRALELGVNWIDTAAAVRLRPLRGGRRPGARRASTERPYVFTKGSLLEGPGRQRSCTA